MAKKSVFTYRIYIQTTPAKLWEALTDPKLTRQYWCEIAPVTDWKKGSTWKLALADGRVLDSGKILEVKKARKLVIKWRNEFIPEFMKDGYSRCTLELEKEKDTVKLIVTHQINKANSQFIAGVALGWPKILSSLKTFCETGKPLEITRRWPKGM